MLIQVKHLTFEYTGFRALNDVSFNISAGNITALVGPNGVGKTTLLRCLAALEQPLNGSIFIDGIDVLDQPRECHRKIGYLSDFFGLYERLTVRQGLYFVARAQGIQPENCNQAITLASKRLNISERLDMTPAQLSRGLRQRVAIAQAIIHQPKVVLLDEPASGLDPEARHSLAELFLELQQQGMTLIVSSHILAELEAYCSEMLVLRGGKIVEQLVVKEHCQQKQRFSLRLVHSLDSFAQVLSVQEQVSSVNINGLDVTFEFSGSENEQYQLLKILLDKNLPVCEFKPLVTNLQEAYLSTVKT